MLKESFKRYYEIGKKYGFVNGLKMVNDTSGNGAIYAIVLFAGVIICLYLSAIVVGSMGSQISTGGIVMSSRWNNTVSSLDSSASSAFSMANVLPIAILYGRVWAFQARRGRELEPASWLSLLVPSVFTNSKASVLKSGESYASTALSPANTLFFRAGRIKR